MKYHHVMTRLISGFLTAAMLLTSPAMPVFAQTEDTQIISDFSLDEARELVDEATLEKGGMEPEVVNISVAAGATIDKSAEVNESNVGNLSGEYGSHDWTQYVSPTLHSRLTASQKQLYDAFDELLSNYLNNSNVDATKYTTSQYSYYVTSSTDFSQYGLTKSEAFAVAQLFLYNNPQYYFVSSVFLTTSSKLWFTFYDEFADGDIRAARTDEVFTKLDSWIVACSDYETTTYQKELSAHERVCSLVEYASNTYDQSIYSTLILNKTVCAGYAECFSMMMNAMGVDTMTVLSSSHAWNVIKLDDGKYYCVDVTWDDTLGDRYLFNVSNSHIKKYDTAAKEHTVASAWTPAWVPGVSSEDYVPTYHDTTGSESSGSIALASPDNLTGVYYSATDSIRIAWSEVTGAAGYEVEAYDASTNQRLGKMTVAVNHMKLSSVSGRSLLIKIRAYGVNEGATCYSNWSTMSYANGMFTAHKGEDDVTLSAPKNFKASNMSDTSFDLAWDKVDGASGYAVYLYADPEKQSKLASLNTTSISLHVNGIASDIPVYAYIRAFKSVSGKTYYSEWSFLAVRQATSGQTTVSGDTAQASALGAPTNAAYTKKTSTTMHVTWKMGTGAKSTNVVVRMGSTDGTKLGSINTSGVAFTLNGVKADKTYYVCLQSVGEDGSLSDWTYLQIKGSASDASNNAGQTNTGDVFGAPASFAYTTISDSSGRLTWNNVSGATSYEVQIASASDYKTLIGKATISGCLVKITGLKSGTSYYARVRAVKADGTVSGWATCSFKPSASSSGGSSETKPVTDTITAPTNLRVTAVDSRNRIAWDQVSAAKSYVVEIYSDSAYKSQVASLPLTGTSVLVNGMSAGRTYYVRVKSVSATGSVSDWATCVYAK